MVDADIEKASDLAVIKEASGTTFTLQPGAYHFTASGHGSSSTGANHITHQLYLPLRSDPSRFDVGAVTLLCGQKVSPGVNLQEASRLQEALGEHAKIRGVENVPSIGLTLFCRSRPLAEATGVVEPPGDSQFASLHLVVSGLPSRRKNRSPRQVLEPSKGCSYGSRKAPAHL
jgi:hypothetical protein